MIEMASVARACARKFVCMGALLLAAQGCAVSSASEGSPERVASSSAAVTVDGNGWAWVLPSGALGSPYAYNSTRGAIISSHAGTGTYKVEFQGIYGFTPAIGHVVAYGSNAQCNLVTFPRAIGFGTTLYVDCYAPGGAPIDTAFVAFVDGRSGNDVSPNGGAFVHTTGGTTPSITGAWNSTGGSNTVAWNSSTSDYTVTFPGIGFYNAGVQVTAYSGGSDRCKIVGWGTGSVNVKCFTAAGVPTASGFGLSYVERAQIARKSGGHAWITAGSVGWGYAAATGDIADCSSPTFSTSRSGSNLVVSLTDADATTGGPAIVPLVSAYGSDATYCNVVGWSVDYRTARVGVSCFDGGGTQIDASSTAFTTTITDAYEPGPC